MQVQKPRDYYFDDFRLDVRKRQLLRESEVLALSPKAFDVLLVLVENAGKLLSKDDLFELVWQDQIVEESNLTVNMSAIRRALNESAKQPRYITTVSGEGYCFVGDVRDDAQDEEYVVESRTIKRVVVEQEEVESEQLALPAGQPNRNKFIFATIAVALISLAAGGYFIRRTYLAKAAGPSPVTSIKKLTNNGKAAATALSRDSKLFAFSMHEGKKTSLWLGYVDGGEPVEIKPASETIYLYLKFSPDGSNLYFVASENFRRGDLYRMPILGGAPEKLADNIRSSPTFSPDGARMAFFRDSADTQKQMLVTTDLKAADEQTVGEIPQGFNVVGNSPVWSPDGATIAIGTASVDGSAGKIFVAKIADKRFDPLAAENWNAVNGLTWLHDGSGLIVVAREKDAISTQLWQVSYPDGASSRIVTDLNLYGGSLSLTADDKNLLALQAQIESNIWVSPADDLTKAKQITFGSPGQNNGWNGIDWTSDNRIIYTKQVNNSITLWSCAADGSNQKQLIPGGGVSILPSIPDAGNYVVFQSNRGGSPAVWRANIDGSNLVQLTGGDVAAQPRVSPDGKWVVYVSDREGEGELTRIPIDGGEALKLTDTKFAWVDISPDSTTIAGGCDENGKPKLCTISIDGGKTISTFDLPRLANIRLGVRWAADGKSICYRDWSNGIWRQQLTGGEPTQIKDLPEEKLYGYGWSPDNKQFAYTRGNEINDVVLISGIR